MPEAYSTTNTKHAAAIGALGFPVAVNLDAEVINDELSGKSSIQFCFQDESPLWPGETLTTIRKGWAARKLPPMHPLLVGLSACHNFELLLDWQKTGRRLRLIGLEQSRRFELRDGEEPPALRWPATAVQLSDLNLTAALATLGFPVVDATGAAGARSYTLAQFGHARRIDERLVTEDAALLMRRAEPGKLDLLLERDDPTHPLCAAYSALHCWSQLRAIVKRRQRNLVMRWPAETQRMVVISEHACDRVLDIAREHFRLPKRHF